MEAIELTPEFVAALINWQKDGRREVDIKMTFDEPTSIWCYDFELMSGAFVNCIESIPNPDTLREKVKQRLLSELKALGE